MRGEQPRGVDLESTRRIGGNVGARLDQIDAAPLPQQEPAYLMVAPRRMGEDRGTIGD
jgi:hypothetical protein